MTSTQIELAKEAGCVTTRQIGLWYHGYLSGKMDGMDVSEEVAERERLDALDIEEEIVRAKFEYDDIYDSIREEFEGKEND